jgi:redox-sensitive bicupin YhaK (pirin superfamily)
MTDEAIETVLRAHPRPVGNQTVQRVLPQMQRRAVGPFVFLDHMGPHDLAPGEGFDVGPHPHIGLATVTYLFEGAGVHRDSLGSMQTILPGELNWMTAGRGIVHSERSPDDLRARGGRMHGLQLWVALPVAEEEGEPSFQHVPAADIATLDVGGAKVRLLAGTAYGARACVATKSPLFYVEAVLEPGQELAFPDEHPERAAYVVEGAVVAFGREVEAHTLVAVAKGSRRLVAKERTRLVMIGGERFPEPRHMRWNFVSSRKARLDEAEQAWRARKFPTIPTDDGELVAMPEIHHP